MADDPSNEINLDILMEDDDLVIINKPYGYFVHRTSLDQHTHQIIVPILRRKIKQRVYPVHRLDRKTSGVLIFAKNKQTQQILNETFRNRDVKKVYRAIVRGYTDQEGKIDYALKNDRGKTQEALTYYQCLQQSELPFSTGKFPTSRYSLIQLEPETGRQHQLRKHMAHIFHPIIGDRPHGCNKQNKYFLENFQLKEMMLHALSLEFLHPITQEQIRIVAPFSSEFLRIGKLLNFSLYA